MIQVILARNENRIFKSQHPSEPLLSKKNLQNFSSDRNFAKLSLIVRSYFLYLRGNKRFVIFMFSDFLFRWLFQYHVCTFTVPKI